MRSKAGALLVLCDDPEVLSICSGGFLVDSPYDDSDVLGTFDLGVLAGIGIDGTLGTVPLTFDVRYTTGFSTVFDFGPDDSDTDDRNQVISFGVGVRVF